jgi:hypothetical protein
MSLPSCANRSLRFYISKVRTDAAPAGAGRTFAACIPQKVPKRRARGGVLRLVAHSFGRHIASGAIPARPPSPRAWLMPAPPRHQSPPTVFTP